jgi:transposase-like protein
VDGLKGFPEAIEAIFPQTVVQTCIVHLIRYSLKYVPRRQYDQVAKDLKPIYTAGDVDQALEALEAFEHKWGKQLRPVVKAWRDSWEYVIPFMAFPPDARRVVYTTNPIEALNRQLRKAIKTKGHFPMTSTAGTLGGCRGLRLAATSGSPQELSADGASVAASLALGRYLERECPCVVRAFVCGGLRRLR